MELFAQANAAALAARQPLAARMRPAGLEDILGQEHILGPGKLLRRAVEADRLGSMIFYGPPGCGKTSLAEVIACVTRRRFVRTSGVTANVAALRDLIAEARRVRAGGGADTILFIDEIHRFSKSQQDVLLPHVEDGTIILVGATTHNPQFFVNTPLTSRSLVFQLQPLTEPAVVALLGRALADPRGLGGQAVRAAPEALVHLSRMCEGDARRALNALEIAVLSTPPGPDGAVELTAAVAADSIQRKLIVYDHDEDGHYDTISAFIKSVRGGDPHAAIYWLAKMVHAGEDPRFVARRLVILAAEDIGNADPRGLTLAVAAMQAVDFVGLPEARIVLAQATAYLATAPKSNAAIVAIDKALADVAEGRVLAVPERLRNVHLRTADGPAPGAAGDAYLYPHDFPGHVVAQDYLPEARRDYEPAPCGYEETIARRLAQWEAARRAAAPAGGAGG